MSFLYPRIVSVYRPAAQSGVGFQAGYAGNTADTETLVAKDLAASIQAKGRQGKDNPVRLPGDSTVSMFTIFIPKGLVMGQLKDRDIIVDDQGVRYQVLADGWDSLGYAAVCQRLEA